MTHFGFQWLLWTVLGSGFLAWLLRKKIPLVLLLPWAFYLMMGCLNSNLVRFTLGKYTTETLGSSIKASFLLLILPLIAFFLNKTQRRRMMLALSILVLLNLGFLIHPGFGMFNAHSFDSSIAMLVVPFVLFCAVPLFFSVGKILIHALLVLLVLFALGCSFHAGGTTTWYLFGMGLGAWYFFKFPRKSSFIVAAILLVSAVGFGSLHMRHSIFYLDGRLPEWKLFMNFWWTNVNHLVGSGTGTFEWLGTLIQVFKNTLPSVGGNPSLLENGFEWMHNDWLQLFFEGGYIGGSLCVVAYGYLLWISHKRPWLISSFLVYGLCMMAQFPGHWIIPEFWFCLLVMEALNNKGLDASNA